MSISEAASQRGSSGDICCPRCGKPLLPQAAFCSSCGERLDKKKALSSLLKDEQEDITNRYRITSLVRRRPFVNLYLALDNQQSHQGVLHMVAIRDIDISSLREETRTQAIELAQQEYDSLRLWHLPHVMPAIDLRYHHGHLFVVSDNAPTASNSGTTGMSRNTKAFTGKVSRLHTLQDFLQSGQGLPSEQQALKWMEYLCHAVDGLHRHHIVIGELDPYTIILNESSDTAEPALMISWISPQLQKLLRSLQMPSSFWSYFCAPEALQGKAEPRSDIYSLGAVLYLLLTGSPPLERALRSKGRLRSPRELNDRISTHVNDCVMQAVSTLPSKRFQNALEMLEALFNPRYSRLQTLKLSRHDNETSHSPAISDEDAETIRIGPLSQKHLDRWRASHPHETAPTLIPHRPLIPPVAAQSRELEKIQAEWQQTPVTPKESQPVSITPANKASTEILPYTSGEQLDEQGISESQPTILQDKPTSLPLQTLESTPVSNWKQRVMVMMPVLSIERLKKSVNRKQTASEQSPRVTVETLDSPFQKAAATTWFGQLQCLVLGQQQRTMMAAALIETPLWVQPNQIFTLRFQILGRDKQTLLLETQEGDHPLGLSSLVHGEKFFIEARLVLNQNDTYVMQHTTVVVPAAGYVTEVTVPIRPLSNVPSGRRDRLHIYFFDQQRHPLYDKPFVVEVFVSHFAKRGHEGYQVLTIPE